MNRNDLVVGTVLLLADENGGYRQSIFGSFPYRRTPLYRAAVQTEQRGEL